VIVVVMGVAGAGKTTVGRALAARLGWPFADADAFHSAGAVAKMARGEGLTDADRAPWLGRLRALIERHLAEGRPLVLACSALKARYRRTLAREGEPVRFVWLDAPADALVERLESRPGHFAGADLLDSQLAALEPPGNALRLDAREPPERLVEAAVAALGLEE
jgi:gluconokinase